MNVDSVPILCTIRTWRISLLCSYSRIHQLLYKRRYSAFFGTAFIYCEQFAECQVLPDICTRQTCLLTLEWICWWHISTHCCICTVTLATNFIQHKVKVFINVIVTCLLISNGVGEVKKLRNLGIVKTLLMETVVLFRQCQG